MVFHSYHPLHYATATPLAKRTACLLALNACKAPAHVEGTAMPGTAGGQMVGNSCCAGGCVAWLRRVPPRSSCPSSLFGCRCGLRPLEAAAVVVVGGARTRAVAAVAAVAVREEEEEPAWPAWVLTTCGGGYGRPWRITCVYVCVFFLNYYYYIE
jgi:hypothetical protein